MGFVFDFDFAEQEIFFFLFTLCSKIISYWSQLT